MRQSFVSLILFCAPSVTWAASQVDLEPCEERFSSHTLTRLARVDVSQKNDKATLRNFDVFWQVGDKTQLLQTGADVEITRCLPPGLWTPIAHGRIVQAQGQFAKADVIEIATPGADNLYAGPMVGDSIGISAVSIIDTPQITPIVQFNWPDLFGIDKIGNLTYQLSESGEKLLMDKVLLFQRAIGRLVVESKSSGVGAKQAFLNETALRNAAVSQFIQRKTSIKNIFQINKISDELAPGWVDPGVQGTVTLRVSNQLD